MTTTALVKEGCGTHFVYDMSELERHKKMGWTERPKDWKEVKLEEDRVKKLEAMKAEQQRLTAELAALELVEVLKAEHQEVKRGPGRPKKSAE